MPSLFILIPLFVIMALNLPGGKRMQGLSFWFAVSLFLVEIMMAIYNHPLIQNRQLVEMDRFFKVGFSVDHLSFIMFFCIGVVSLASLVVARHTIIEEAYRFKFINLLILASIGMCGIVLAQDLFTLYVFLEITAVTSFILIAFEKDLASLEGAFKYIIMSVIATALMLAGMAIILLVARSTSFISVASALRMSGGSPIIAFAVGIFICGLLIKGGLVPFHGWVPDAYQSASSGVSVLLGGIVTKVCGIYTLMRLVSALFGFTEPLKNALLLIGAVSILVGAFAALGQKDFKRLLAYSSISQVGYIILGFATGTPLGIAGAAFHFFNHAIFKSLLFVNAAAVERETGTGTITRMGGIAARMPATGATSVIGLLSASGIPPLSGFWSKLMIVIALWQAGRTGYAVVAVLAGVLTLAYFLVLQRRVFFGKLAEGLEDIREPGAGIVSIQVVLAAITIAAGVFFPYIFTRFILPLGHLASGG